MKLYKNEKGNFRWAYTFDLIQNNKLLYKILAIYVGLILLLGLILGILSKDLNKTITIFCLILLGGISLISTLYYIGTIFKPGEKFTLYEMNDEEIRIVDKGNEYSKDRIRVWLKESLELNCGAIHIPFKEIEYIKVNYNKEMIEIFTQSKKKKIYINNNYLEFLSEFIRGKMSFTKGHN